MGLLRKDEKCTVCGMEFRTKAELEHHIQRVHPPTGQPSPSPAIPPAAIPPGAVPPQPPQPATPMAARAGAQPASPGRTAAPQTARPAGGIQCGLCGRVFGSAPLLAEHTVRVHPDQAAPRQQ